MSVSEEIERLAVAARLERRDRSRRAGAGHGQPPPRRLGEGEARPDQRRRDPASRRVTAASGRTPSPDSISTEGGARMSETSTTSPTTGRPSRRRLDPRHALARLRDRHPGRVVGELPAPSSLTPIAPARGGTARPRLHAWTTTRRRCSAGRRPSPPRVVAPRAWPMPSAASAVPADRPRWSDPPFGRPATVGSRCRQRRLVRARQPSGADVDSTGAVPRFGLGVIRSPT